MRLDQLIVLKSMAKSRNRARALIDCGAVEVFIGNHWQKITKPSFSVEANTKVRIDQSKHPTYVSRAGEKLEGALKHTGLNIRDEWVLDIGQSTGGFTDCALAFGAKKVVGIDVGRDQLASSLVGHENVICLEGINARNLPVDQLLTYTNQIGYGCVVMDLSFISQTYAISHVALLLKEGGHLLSLVKPQFEVGKEGIGKGGIVRDESLYPMVKEKIITEYETHDMEVLDYFDSSLKGGDGNREFFVFAVKQKICEL